MGQKVSPIGLRLGINRTADSRWYAEGDAYATQLHLDMRIREMLVKRLEGAGVSKVIIERMAKKARVTIHTARPGIVTGKHGRVMSAVPTASVVVCVRVRYGSIVMMKVVTRISPSVVINNRVMAVINRYMPWKNTQN